MAVFGGGEEPENRIAASYYVARARQALSAEGRDPSRFLGDIPETFEAHALAEIASTTDKSKHWLMLRNFGHRAMLDYELPEPRYGEDLYTLNRMIAGRGRITAGPRDTEDNRDRRCCGFGRECSWSAAGRGDQGHLLVDEFSH